MNGIWTDEEIDMALKMRGAGKSYHSIGKALNRPWRGVEARLDRHNLYERANCRDYSAERFVEEAKCGSEKLENRLHSYFSKWERVHGFRPGAGLLLVPAGYNPEAARMAA